MTTPSFAFPQSLAEKYRPKAIAEFIGLEKPKRILSKFAAQPYPSAWLFVGPSGVGKTRMAQALCEQIRGE
jgi:DNA polymerase III gamma/tau subunit